MAVERTSGGPCLPALNVLAIQNYGSSGSMFLQSLLDGHPDMLLTPALHSYHFFKEWREQINPSDRPVEVFLARVEHYFATPPEFAPWGLTELGPDRNEAADIDRARFHDALLHYLPPERRPTRRELFVAQYLAYAEALGRNVAAASLIVFPVHSHAAEIVRDLLEDFPDTLFLYTVRHPIQTLGSHLKNIARVPQACNLVEAVLLLLTVGYTIELDQSRFCYPDRPYPGVARTNCRAVRLEDLHQQPRETLRRLCQWLQIDWDERLLTSTFNGKAWWNRPGSTRVSGFSTAIVSRQHADVITAFDRWRLFELFKTRSRAWGYPLPGWIGQPLLQVPLLFAYTWPLRMEFRAWPSRRDHLRRWARRRAVAWTRRTSGRRMPRLLFWVFFLGLVCWFLVRDYLAIRCVLYQAWWHDRRRGQEVDLL